ncbi:MAG: RNA methyltransferase [Bacteroidetes bacterium]|nr:RNA methyltransferase [Bacteroidota bacterium]MCB9044066.1 RNA methyltransferase [Chitinophagales bacterium]
MHKLLGLENFFVQQAETLEKYEKFIQFIQKNELKSISALQSPNSLLAIFSQIENVWDKDTDNFNFALYLDNIRDPGNLGTIIRTAVWFGHKVLFLSPECADIYNPKVVQASMGNLGFVKIIRTEIADILQNIPNVNIFVADMHGISLVDCVFPSPSLLVMGNEANGTAVMKDATNFPKVTIPAYGKAESLNVSIAAAIFSYHQKLK